MRRAMISGVCMCFFSLLVVSCGSSVPANGHVGGLAYCGTGAGNLSGPDRLLGLVLDGARDSLYMVDLQTRSASLPIPVGPDPIALAVTPDGKWAYVVDGGYSTAKNMSAYRHSSIFKGAVVPVNLATGRASRPIYSGLGPISIAITPNGKWAYVADMGILGGVGNSSFAVDASTVTPIDLATGRPGKPIQVGPGPGAIAITPNGKWAYVADTGTPVHPVNYVVPINLATGKVGSPIHTGISPMAIAITPNGKWAYVADTGWPQARLQGHYVTPINLATNRPGKPIPVGAAPLSIAITPNGKWAYVANSGYGFGNHFTVTPIDLATDRPSKPIPVGAGPTWVAITPNGKWAYVADVGTFGSYNGGTIPGREITPINLSGNCPGKPIKLGNSPAAIAIVAEPAYLVNRLVKK